MHRPALVALLVALAAFAVVARSWPSPASPPAPPPMVEVTLQEMAFIPGRIEIPAGGATIRLVNAGSLEHDFSINALRVSPNVRPGQTADLEIVGEPGEYPVYCSLPGHKAAGMAATLVILP